ncbi:MAG: response regulator transcription factor [Saprospiraceae bacterium]|uniref:Phosphate regulon transcriptional regulatory protein PhoB n=1 Tax=Candidatus Opimibacter skivensis TaxID=2982028 RepID=A0A9D7SXJ1_9BACT|nr:response regulator transcription factor [Candidatus Opimibacter skivensis]
MDNKIKVLIVDDEPDILEFLEYNLSRNGFETIQASNGLEAIKIADKEVPDLILLDIMMPGMDGVQTCYELRKNDKLKDCLIAFLTARSEEFSEIAGLEAGADDYIQKPIRPRLLLSRIKALMRRKESSRVSPTAGNILDFGALKIDPQSYQVIIDGEVITLAKKEFEVIMLLASKPGKVFTREEMFSKVWGYTVPIASRTIDVHISKLREKVGERFIKTLKGVGYKLEVEE